MNSLISNFTYVFTMIHIKATLGIVLLILSFSSSNAQTYNPKNGFTHYPNGTVYICNCVGGFGPEPVVIGPNGETAGCTTEEERCSEILKEADDHATSNGGTTGGSVGAGTGETTQSYSPDVSNSMKEYQKQLKVKYGIWANQNGKWIYATIPHEWTTEIFRSWKKRK